MAQARAPGGSPSPGLHAGLVFAALQLLLVGNPSLVELNPEELYNAAHAEAILALGGDVVLPLQYRPFCGGCTLDALLGAALFATAGPTLLSWKLVPILLGAVGVGALVHAASHHAGRASAWALALLLAVATPPAWSRLGLVAWGNHYECATVVLVALALWAAPPRPGRDLALGLALGLGLAIGWSAAFALPVVGLGLLAARAPGPLLRVAAGAALGFSPALLRAALTGELPTATIYRADEAIPKLALLPERLATLLPPPQLAGLLGVTHPQAGPALGVLAALTLALALPLSLRRPGLPRRAAALLLAWLAVYCLVGFQVQVPGDGTVPSAEGLRYAAPAMPLAAAVVALVAGQAWQAGRRLGPALLLLPWLLAGIGARAAALAPPFPRASAAAMWPGDMAFFREQASWALPLPLHRAHLVDGAPRLRPVHAYAVGRADLSATLPPGPLPPGSVPPTLSPPAGAHTPAWAQGVAALAVDRLDEGDTGDATALAAAMAWVEAAAVGWTASERQAALREVAWRRADGGAPDPLLGPLVDGADLRALQARTVRLALSPAAAQATWWAAGRRWGRDRARLWAPGAIELPVQALPPGAPAAAFAEGLGQALAERWGPAARQAPPARLEGPARSAFSRGVEAGLAARWRGAGPESE